MSDEKKPPLQQIPLRTEEARQLRELVAEPVSAPVDYAQVELRIAAGRLREWTESESPTFWRDLFLGRKPR